ncbi:hypothetical protein BsWGS_10488 [Bradybaena similaris]
MQHSLVRPV